MRSSKRNVSVHLHLALKITIVIILNSICLQSATAKQALQFDSSNRTDAIDNSNCSITPLKTSLAKYVPEDDCAFQALEILNKQYHCADRPFIKKLTTRDEFATRINDCLQKVSDARLSERTIVNRESLNAIEILESKFASELEELKQQTEELNARTTQLEKERFFSTVKLSGTAIFSGINYLSREGQNQLVLQQQTYLNISASFTGKDNLSFGIVASNADIPNLSSTNNQKDVGSTREGLTIWEYGGSTENELNLSNLAYTFPIVDTEDKQLYLSIAFLDGFNTSGFLPTAGHATQPGRIGYGAISTFGQNNPIYLLNSGAGAIAQYDTDFAGFTVAYLASRAGALALAELNLTPSEQFAVALTYQVNYFNAGRFAYSNQIQGANTPGIVGTALANRFDNEGVFFDENVRVSSNSYSVQAFWEINQAVTIGGFATKTDARLLGQGSADVWSYAVSLNFPDLGQEGNQAGLIVGVEPTLTSIDAVGISDEDFESDTSLHVEAFYQHKLSDNISITPGVIWISAPNQDANNADIVEGVIRATFSL